MLRGDSKQRAESNKIGLQNGWLSINEVRARENLNPIPGGDQHWFPMNFQPITATTEEGRLAREVQKYLETKNGDMPPEIKKEIQDLIK